MTIKSVLAIPPSSFRASYESRTTSPVPARLGHQNATLPADAWIAGGAGFRCGKEGGPTVDVSEILQTVYM